MGVATFQIEVLIMQILNKSKELNVMQVLTQLQDNAPQEKKIRKNLLYLNYDFFKIYIFKKKICDLVV